MTPRHMEKVCLHRPPAAAKLNWVPSCRDFGALTIETKLKIKCDTLPFLLF